ncbi:MAG: nitroreductase family protein [Actinomycetota bacterium]|nr:nitroreductase family protein [Actinomycetota bacterium]
MSYVPQRLDFPRLSEAEAARRSAEFLALMRRRRSVRHFSSEPVAFELIANAVRTAATAPSGANQQPWRFVVIANAEVKAAIRAAAEREEELLYRERATREFLEAIDPLGTDWLKPHLTDAPYLIAVFEEPWSRDEGGEKRKNYYVRESVGIAVGLLLAALHNAGLATLTHTPSPMRFLKQILDRPDNERPFLLIPVGYPVRDATVPTLARKPFEQIVELVD